jgi:hypothetical protein
MDENGHIQAGKACMHAYTITSIKQPCK